MKMKTALTIAGSDSGGGAGIQADIKTMMANGVYAMSAITALTAQNTTKSSRYYGSDTAVSGRAAGLHFTDIRPDAVKTGMVASADLIRTIAGKLTEYQAENIVVDPVMVSTSGARLISEEAIETLKEKLFPLATVITPNIPEAEVLADMEIETVQDMEKAAEVIGTRYGCSVLLKGGHQKNDASDLLWQKDKKPVWFHGVRIGQSKQRTEPDVRFLLRSHPILRRAEIWKLRLRRQNAIFPGHWQRCWILDLAAVR